MEEAEGLSLSEKIKGLPAASGVYLMKDGRQNIIYVGKAKNLKNRVNSYFRAGDGHVKTKALVNEIADFDLIITSNEVEAILLERTLIRHHAPRFNIMLRDDKEYPWVRINFHDQWPRIDKVRQRKDDGATYAGPFANAGALNTMLKTVFRIFPLIRCSPYEFRTVKRPCNYYHMKMCQAPCHNKVSEDDYEATVRDALALLQGRNTHLKRDLTAKMLAASGAEQFEQAAALRDQIRALENMRERQVAVVKSLRDGDIIGYCEDKNTLVFHVLMVRDQRIIGSENYLLKSEVQREGEALSSFLLQYYDRRPLPEELVLPFPAESQEDLLVALKSEEKQKIRVRIQGRGEIRKLADLAAKNATGYYQQHLDMGARQKAELDILKETLELPALPRRMECLDISNLQSSSIVAAVVCFIDGRPAKELYRKYEIKTVTETHDDYASIAEVVQRRIERGLRDDDLPDLLVIDGGKGQLNAALEVSSRYPNLQLNLAGLAKSRPDPGDRRLTRAPVRSAERVFLPDQETGIPLKEGSPEHRLLSRIRDEAHRFAISFHRKKRGKAAHASVLDEVKGLGPVLKKRLLQEFGGLQGLQKASLDQLLQVKGLSEKVATALHSRLHQ